MTGIEGIDRRRLARWVAAFGAGAGVGASTIAGAPPAQAARKGPDRTFARLIRRRGSATHRALLDLVAARQLDFADQDLPELLGREARDPSSSLRRALSGVFLAESAGPPPSGDPSAGAGLLPPTAALMSWDGFQRTDRTLAGDRAPSGHVYRIGGVPEDNMVRAGRYAPRPVPRKATVLYVEHDRVPDTVAAEFVWTPGTTYGANAVVGACDVGFGAGSIQLAVYPHRDGRRDYDWSLFVVPSPIQDPYPVLAQGQLQTDFVWKMDGAQRYRVYLHRIGSDKVMIQLPDGQVVTQQHPDIATYWGKVTGTQLRRQQTGDAFAEFTAIAASGGG